MPRDPRLYTIVSSLASKQPARAVDAFKSVLTERVEARVAEFAKQQTQGTQPNDA